jgi:exopolyphosphatase / guanosine-5'-triphosphate,3'-diphosphate pyrophosphatase
MRKAVIDLGTNTCNLLIAEVNNSIYNILYQGKEWVRLGDDSINDNIISNKAFERTIKAFKNHSRIIRDYNVHEIRIMATSAVRTAENQDLFLHEIKEETGFTIEIITGEQEAELIHKGVLLAFERIKEPSLILDIGGGSNEFIISLNDEIAWIESLPTGVSRFVNQYPLSDPVSPAEINYIGKYFIENHQQSIYNSQKLGIKTLIGCAGAFDTIADLIDKVDPMTKKRAKQLISLKAFQRVYQNLIHSTRAQRLQMKGMDRVRADLIVPAVIFVNQIITRIGITQIYQTDYALREGVLYDILNS